MNCREIDMTADPRGAHFAYFCSLASPAAGLTVPVDVTDLVKNLRGRSFFLSFLWCLRIPIFLYHFMKNNCGVKSNFEFWVPKSMWSNIIRFWEIREFGKPVLCVLIIAKTILNK
jgi:hypothetical protein